MSKGKKICIISPSLKIGGIERALTVLANYFCGLDYPVTFIACLSGEPFYHLDPKIQLIQPTFKRTNTFINKLTFYLKINWFIRRKVKSVAPDVVLTFGDWFSPLTLLSLLGTNYPVFISDRTSPDYNFEFPIPQLKRWLYPKSAGFIAQTKRAANYKHNQFGNKLNIKIIPNAIREVKKYSFKEEKIILYVGRFAWEKGPDRLIHAFANLRDKMGWKLHMAGSGPLLNIMKALTQQLNIEKEVFFHGEVKEIDLLFSKAGIYVLPSVLEGFPNALCEAMAAGLPCICFDSIPYEDILESGKSGIVVPNNNLSELSKQLEKLMSNKDKRIEIGRNSKKIRERLSVEVVGQQILDFIFSK